MQGYRVQVCRRSGIAVLVSFFLGATTAFASQPTPPVVPAPLPASREPIAAVGPSPATVWGGIDVSPSSKAIFAGGIYALNGDLSQDGFLVRGSITLGEYESGIFSADESDVAFQNVNLLIGYQTAVGTGHAAFFIGPDFTHNGADASADVRGSSWGVRGIADIIIPLSPNFQLSSWATYSTIEDQYYIQGRALYRPSDRFRMGPEIAFLGGDTWRQHRAGIHAAGALPIGELGISVGHAWSRRSDGGDGGYANAILSIRL